jgi:hypothetical protein
VKHWAVDVSFMFHARSVFVMAAWLFLKRALQQQGDSCVEATTALADRYVRRGNARGLSPKTSA